LFGYLIHSLEFTDIQVASLLARCGLTLQVWKSRRSSAAPCGALRRAAVRCGALRQWTVRRRTSFTGQQPHSSFAADIHVTAFDIATFELTNRQPRKFACY
jgi:hypothetical protein